MQRQLSMLIVIGFLSAFALVAPAADATTACNGHTDADRQSCDSTCSQGQKLGVFMDLDDSSESGSATSTCSNQTASCSIAVNADSCTGTSIGTTAATGGWTCYFEAHDVWWNPDNGFTYNCYSFTPGALLLQSPSVEADVDGLCTASGVELVHELCTHAHNGALVAYAQTQVLVRGKAGEAVGFACDAEAGCWMVEPICVETATAFSCAVTPRA